MKTKIQNAKRKLDEIVRSGPAIYISGVALGASATYVIMHKRIPASTETFWLKPEHAKTLIEEAGQTMVSFDLPKRTVNVAVDNLSQ